MRFVLLFSFLLPCIVHGQSNQATSLRILYQNNLNSTDDANHFPFLLLESTTESQAAKSCAAFGESLVTSSEINIYRSDFERLFAYLIYTNPLEFAFHIQDAVVVADFAGDYTITRSFAASLPVICTQSLAGSSATASNEINVISNTNQYTGFRQRKAFTFLGVPFANVPSRFEYSTIYSGTDQHIQATSYSAQCAQVASGSEDCLYLNIYSPYLPKSGTQQNLRPVLFWIHGGGFTGGNGQFDGSNLASREDVVVVSIQYRLSTLGFLAVPGTDIKGNYGIADQITALEWVKRNIAAFGGDPSKITIFGESAGAGSVRVLLGSPPAIGMYRGAIAMSNLGGGVALGLAGDYSTTYSSYLTISGSYSASKALFTEAGCNQATVQEQIACLRLVDPLRLVELPTVARYVVQDGTYVNTAQLIVNTRNSSTAHVPVMFGNLAGDGASFISYQHNIENESQGLQENLGISEFYADSIISSGLFPFPNTGNLSLDAFNVSARVYTDVGFRCIDQATVYAGVLSKAFLSAYYYQFERSIGGYDPNNVGNPPASPGYPYGNPNLPYFRVHAGDLASAFGNLGPTQIRDPQDLYFTQLVSGYWSEFSRSLQPNPSYEYLKVRGYSETLAAVSRVPWNSVGSTGTPVQRLDYPPYKTTYIDQSQCKWLNYSLSYYLDSNRG